MPKPKKKSRDADDDYTLPDEKQQIGKITEWYGRNIGKVKSHEGRELTVFMPPNLRKNLQVFRGIFVLIEDVEADGKVKANVVKILHRDYIKYLKKEGVWPDVFEDKPSVQDNEPLSEDDDGLFENKNRYCDVSDYSGDSPSDSDD